MKSSVIIFLVLSALATNSMGQEDPFTAGHSHNDYQQKDPLVEALALGYGSIEIDIFRIGNKLYVCHNRPLIKNQQKTLSEMYLRPLKELYNTNGGRIYPGSDIPVVLMIDIKSDGRKTYELLKKELQLYKELFNTSNQSIANKVLISGNVPYSTIINDHQRNVAIDGRPDDLEHKYHTEFMPYISQSFEAISSWNGKGKIPENDLKTIRELAKKIHAQGKKLRLWGIPDHENSWEQLLKAGVDIINTDKLKEFKDYYNKVYLNNFVVEAE